MTNLERVIALGTLVDGLVNRINERGQKKEDMDYVMNRLAKEFGLGDTDETE